MAKYDPNKPLPLKYLLPLVAVVFAIMIYAIKRGWLGME